MSGACQCPAHLADGGVEVVLGVHGWRWDVIGASPDLHLRLAVFGRRLGLVEARQATVVALVQTPGAMHGQPHLIDAVQHQPQGPDGTLQHRRVADVKLITRIYRRGTTASASLCMCTTLQSSGVSKIESVAS